MNKKRYAAQAAKNIKVNKSNSKKELTRKKQRTGGLSAKRRAKPESISPR